MLMKSVRQHEHILELCSRVGKLHKIYSIHITKRSNFIMFTTEKVIASPHKLERMQNTISTTFTVPNRQIHSHISIGILIL